MCKQPPRPWNRQPQQRRLTPQRPQRVLTSREALRATNNNWLANNPNPSPNQGDRLIGLLYRGFREVIRREQQQQRAPLTQQGRPAQPRNTSGELDALLADWRTDHRGRKRGAGEILQSRAQDRRHIRVVHSRTPQSPFSCVLRLPVANITVPQSSSASPSDEE